MPKGFLRRVAVVPTITTTNIASADIFANTTEIPGACACVNEPTYLVGMNVTDYGDNTAADLQIVFLSVSTSLGTGSSAPSIADTDGILGYITIASADWKDLGGFKWVRIDPAKLPLPLIPATGTASVYFGIIAGGAMTNSASDIKCEFFFQDLYPF